MAHLPDRSAKDRKKPKAKLKITLTYPIMQEATIQALNRLYGDRGWHCDHIWADKTAPACVIDYLTVHRAPATVKLGIDPKPTLFATFEGKRVRVVMASRFGDVGITENLDAEYGYSRRLFLPELTDFATAP